MVGLSSLLSADDGKTTLAALGAATGLDAAATVGLLPELRELWGNRMVVLAVG